MLKGHNPHALLGRGNQTDLHKGTKTAVAPTNTAATSHPPLTVLAPLLEQALHHHHYQALHHHHYHRHHHHHLPTTTNENLQDATKQEIGFPIISEEISVIAKCPAGYKGNPVLTCRRRDDGEMEVVHKYHTRSTACRPSD